MLRKNILFVDDNNNVISGLQRLLRPYREQWQLFFAHSGAQALDIMQQNPIDLIVSDMMMPEMRGDELLKKVAELYPSTVRMILSGYANDETLKNALAVAHQYLSKPCSADVLREAISQVFKVQVCASNPQLIEVLGDINQLPSLPKIYHELNSAIANEDSNSNEIAQIFARDMVLSAKLLQLINSPYFGLNRTISSLSEAINLIGVKKLNLLVVSVHARTAFPVANPEIEHLMEFIWSDAARVSELARLIAIAENQVGDRPDQAYLAGLLHNLGLLIFASRSTQKIKQLFALLESTSASVTTLESEIFGFSRSEAAAYVLNLWKIPPGIIEAILLQYTPNQSDYDGMTALTAVHVAACLMQPDITPGYARLFEISLDTPYLARINKLERLPEWQLAANKILKNYAHA